jgi:hypothetical protein
MPEPKLSLAAPGDGADSDEGLLAALTRGTALERVG